jgi:hypothetical protein
MAVVTKELTQDQHHIMYTAVSMTSVSWLTQKDMELVITRVWRKKASPSKQPTAKSIDFQISGNIYNAHYDYELSSNTYKRSQAGAPHLDANGKQINPTVVVALIMPYSLESDRLHSSYETLGTGSSCISSKDGKVTIGSWTKEDNQSQFKFQDSNGNS